MANRLPAPLGWWTISRPRIALLRPDGSAAYAMFFPIHSKGGDDVKMTQWGSTNDLQGGRRRVRQKTGYTVDIKLKWSAAVAQAVEMITYPEGGGEDTLTLMSVAQAVGVLYNRHLLEGMRMHFFRNPDVVDWVDVTIMPGAVPNYQDTAGIMRDVVLELTSTGIWTPVGAAYPAVVE